MRWMHLLAAVTLIFSVALADDAPTASPADAPNTWVRLPVKPEVGYMCAPLVYDPVRRQVLHWGGVSREGHPPGRNDVRALDLEKNAWVSDYPSTTKAEARVAETGIGYMIKGVPAPAHVVFAAAYDSKRKRFVYCMPKLMAAYDPAAKTWSQMKAETELYGKRYPGGPPVYGAGMEYDPVNDELVMFPHWGCLNFDEYEQTGRLTGHLGTMVFSFETGLWRRLRDIRTPPDEECRAELTDLVGRQLALIDRIRRLRLEDAGEDRAAILAGQTALVKAIGAGAAARHEAAKDTVAKAGAAVSEAAAAVEKKDDRRAIQQAGWAVRHLDAARDRDLRWEPTPRGTAPLRYDPTHKQIVLFGGHGGTGYLNDTWTYDCATRTWRKRTPKTAPPPLPYPLFFRHEKSGLMLLVESSGPSRDRRKPYSYIWSYDLATDTWARRVRFPGHLRNDGGGWTGVIYDPAADLLIRQQAAYFGGGRNQQTWAMKLDLGDPIETRETFSERSYIPPPAPPEIPDTDATWLAEVAKWPANTWKRVNPKDGGWAARDWSNLGYDPKLHWVVHSGGGHSTYQVSDPVAYLPGANMVLNYRPGDSNVILPHRGWGGGAGVGIWGAPRTSHKRNEYVAFNGVLYLNQYAYVSYFYGPEKWADRLRQFFNTGRSSFTAKWAYDLEAGGRWRWLLKDEQLAGIPTGMSTDRGTAAVGWGTAYRYGPIVRAGVHVYDIISGEKRVGTTIDKAGAFPVSHQGESRTFCYLPGRDEIFIAGMGKTKNETWVFRVKDAAFVKLEPKAASPASASVGTVFDIPGKGLVVASLRHREWGRNKRQLWVYSLDRNTWRQLPTAGPQARSTGPYEQMVYDDAHGLIVWFDPLHLLRPDWSAIEW